MSKRWFLILLLIGLLLSPTFAQDNLLNNPGFEGDYSADSTGIAELNFAGGWAGWWTDSPKGEVWQNERPNGFPHTGSLKRSGDRAQNVGRGFATFTAAAYQTLQVNPGDILRGSAWVFIENAGDKGARARVGFANGSIRNPQSSAISWSGWMREVGSYQQIQTEFTASEGTVTFFIYMAQDAPNDPNQYYIDDASVVVIGTGTPPTATPLPGANNTPVPTAVPTNTPIPLAPFVDPQAANEQGQLVHTVIAGDTLAAIAVAYSVPASTIRELNGLQTNILQIGQQLLIKEAVAVVVAPTTTPRPEDLNPSPVPTQPVQPTAPVGVIPSITPGIAVQPAQPTPTPGVAVDVVQPTVTAIQVAQAATPTAIQVAAVPDKTGFLGDPPADRGLICVFMYDDRNQNQTQDADEVRIGGGIVAIADGGNTAINQQEMTASEHCFEPIAPGTYSISASALEGFELSSAGSLLINVEAGARFRVAFGVRQTGNPGAGSAAAPVADAADNPGNLLALFFIGLANFMGGG